MTRINTNVSSLTAQKTLSRTNEDLQTALTRLSTGLRINSGKDDPAGMIAAEIMKNNTTAMQKAIVNTQRGSQMIATTDSALGQITSLLHDVRALVTEASNTAVMSNEQIAANQLQVDSALQAIDRVSQVTKFQGRRLLDGSLDFITTANNVSQIENLRIDQANLGATGQLPIAVEIAAAAERAEISTSSGAQPASAQLKFAARYDAAITAGGAGATFSIVANSNSTAFDGVTVDFSIRAGATAVSYDSVGKKLNIGFANTETAANLETAVEATGLFSVITDAAGAVTVAADGTMAQDVIDITAATEGADFNNVKVKIVQDPLATAAAPTASYNADTKVITVGLLGTGTIATGSTITDIASAIDGLADFASTSTGTNLIHGALSSDTSALASTSESGYIKTAFSSGTRANATISFGAGAQWNAGGTNKIDIKATALGTTADQVKINFIDDVTAGNESAEYDELAKTLNVHVELGTSDAGDVMAAIDATGSWKTTDIGGGAVGTTIGATEASLTTGIDKINVESLNTGANYNNMSVKFETVSTGSGAVASYDATNNEFTIQVKYSDLGTDKVTLEQIAAAINSVSGFAGSIVKQGTGEIVGKSVDATATGNTGSTGGNALLDDLVMEVGSVEGMQVFNFSKGTTSNQVAAAINAVSDATGAIAYQNNDLVELRSAGYGSKQFVSVNVLNEGANGLLKSSLSAFRAVGTDIQAKINGIEASSDGNKMWINTSMLAMTIDAEAEITDNFNFLITGGGAQFQLGPDVVSNQQLRVGIQSINTAKMGGVNGKLYQLATGGDADLFTDPNKGAKIIMEAIGSVTELRGRLGAIQGLSMDTNIKTLQDMVENLTTAESEIRDADFAAESANLTRAQILTQSGMSVLSIANKQPEQVLALLRQ